MFEFFQNVAVLFLIALFIGLYKPSIFKLDSKKQVFVRIFPVFFILFAIGMSLEPSKDDSNDAYSKESIDARIADGKAQESTKTIDKPAIQEQKTVEQEKKEPIKPFDISVTNLIVKKVDGDCRYFFAVKNNDTRELKGALTIELWRSNDAKSPNGSDTFNMNVLPNISASNFIDIYTCPKALHGDYGITDFKYTLSYDGQSQNGDGKITDKFENLNK